LRRRSVDRRRKKKPQKKWSVSICVTIQDEINKKVTEWTFWSLFQSQKWPNFQSSRGQRALEENCLQDQPQQQQRVESDDWWDQPFVRGAQWIWKTRGGKDENPQKAVWAGQKDIKKFDWKRDKLEWARINEETLHNRNISQEKWLLSSSKLRRHREP
jgi:hypothetical protein